MKTCFFKAKTPKTICLDRSRIPPQNRWLPHPRLGYARWLRNIAIGIGNSPYSEENISALKAKENFKDEAVREHVKWALAEQSKKSYLIR